ncbi:TetR/AcrR family transcriptional regulator [Methylorubrum podarium]|jgi:AcrR family transcriptional regulator|uniref:TetR/AcrR family transcriptional regulator n=1 Tax=Methylorubrum podarium TaxID=200476 RepID=A0ABV1QN96_9HYPH|nr:TetR/AcrR family transcriptional regulator [Methylorubrum podarium]MDV2986236.1 TetR/AcrR family transcriptional regulator [Methylobacteriaceae bacterium AG10]GJE71477.1 HTH-type transcriptional regulator BetI [Methylorubrum podarium]
MPAATAHLLPPSDETGPTTRDRIVEAAARSFQEIGYQKTTVADIARTLKMSPANVYRFFDSKKAINEAVVEKLTGEIEAMIAAIADAPKLDAPERLTRIITALHDDCRRRFEAHPRVHEMVEAAMSESWGVCQAHVDRIGAVLARVVADGMREGAFAVADAKSAAACLQAGVTRYCHPMLVGRQPNTIEPPLPVMIAFLLGSLRAAGR